MIRALANASSKHHDLSAPQIALDVIGFCVTVAVTIICATYAKRRLNVLQTDDEPLLQWVLGERKSQSHASGFRIAGFGF